MQSLSQKGRKKLVIINLLLYGLKADFIHQYKRMRIMNHPTVLNAVFFACDQRNSSQYGLAFLGSLSLGMSGNGWATTILISIIAICVELASIPTKLICVSGKITVQARNIIAPPLVFDAQKTNPLDKKDGRHYNFAYLSLK